MRAEERVASFLLDLGRRYQALGFSGSRFHLRMSRADIGSYLGLRLETVSRLLSRFQVEGLLRVEGKSMQIIDADGLGSLIGQG
jgi:CRP/FNR family transcriptional regulator